MRIGAMIGADGTKSSIDEVIQLGKDMEQAGLDHVAQLQQTHAQTVAAWLWSINKTANGQVVQNAMRCGWMEPCFFANFFASSISSNALEPFRASTLPP